MSFGSDIETLADYNARLAACGCCQVPTFAAPTRTDQQRDVTRSIVSIIPTGASGTGIFWGVCIPFQLVGSPDDADWIPLYRRSTFVDDTGPGGSPYTYDCSPTHNTIIELGDTFTVDLDVSFTEVYDKCVDDIPDWTTGTLGTRLIVTWPTAGEFSAAAGGYTPCPLPIEHRGSSGGTITLTDSRVRWSIPTAFPGTSAVITFDEVFYPQGYNFSNPSLTPHLLPSLHNEDITIEWTGPGDPSDAATWLTDWHTLPRLDPIYSQRGYIHVRNARIAYYPDFPPIPFGPAQVIP